MREEKGKIGQEVEYSDNWTGYSFGVGRFDFVGDGRFGDVGEGRARSFGGVDIGQRL